MGKIDEEAARALWSWHPLSKGNTQVLVNGEASALHLHGNLIAYLDRAGKLCITLAGWPTVTTRSRLNALPGVRVHQHKGEQYLNGEPWDGSWTTI